MVVGQPGVFAEMATLQLSCKCKLLFSAGSVIAVLDLRASILLDVINQGPRLNELRIAARARKLLLGRVELGGEMLTSFARRFGGLKSVYLFMVAALRLGSMKQDHALRAVVVSLAFIPSLLPVGQEGCATAHLDFALFAGGAHVVYTPPPELRRDWNRAEKYRQNARFWDERVRENFRMKV
jgi:hypothetical protein